MAKPQTLEQLKHDKALVKNNFPNFVETFNYTVNRLENIKGDKDVNDEQGHITFDVTDPEHPVIRIDESYESLGNMILSTQVNTISTIISSVPSDISAISAQTSSLIGGQNLTCYVLSSMDVQVDRISFGRMRLMFKNGILTAYEGITPVGIQTETYNNI